MRRVEMRTGSRMNTRKPCFLGVVMLNAIAETACYRRVNPSRRTLVPALLVTTLVSSSVAIAQTANRQLPKHTGPAAVGRIAFYWKDDTRGEPNTPDEGDRRELRVDVWYPA